MKENARLKSEMTKASTSKIILLKGKQVVETPIVEPHTRQGKEGLGYVPPMMMNAKKGIPKSANPSKPRRPTPFNPRTVLRVGMPQGASLLVKITPGTTTLIMLYMSIIMGMFVLVTLDPTMVLFHMLFGFLSLL